MAKVGRQAHAVFLVIILCYVIESESIKVLEDAAPAAVDDGSSNAKTFQSAPDEMIPRNNDGGINDESSIDQTTYTVNLGDLFKEMNIYNRIVKDVSSRYENKKTLDDGATKRVTRQAHAGYSSSLYPQLPTAPPYNQYQPYANSNNSPYYNQGGYQPSYNQQQPNYPQNNYPQSGYTSHTNNYNTNNSSQLYDFYGRQTPYNPTYPYNTRPGTQPTGTYPPNNNPQSGSSYQPPNSGFQSNLPNYNRPNGQFGQQQFHNNSYPGYPPKPWLNHTGSYNPSPRPAYYPSGNQTFSTHHPSYPSNGYNNIHPFTPFNSTTPRQPYQPNQYPSFNNSQTHSPWPGVTPSVNTSYSNVPNGRYPHSSFGQNNNIYPQYGPAHGSVNSTFNYNGPNQRWPNYSASNGNIPTQNSYSPGPQPHGYVHNSSNPTLPFNPYQVPTNGEYPFQGPHNVNYNGTSTYRLAGSYNPNIPSQPPYTSKFNGTGVDPTRVSPEHFSYNY